MKNWRMAHAVLLEHGVQILQAPRLVPQSGLAHLDDQCSRVERSGSAFLYSETGRDQWTGERGHAAAASGCGKK
ncbi:MAG: hypothetical protein SGJ01_19415, partial [Gemmatimonadota bacterium]|nr:hypothetical protein [Gemmatimonadota bacterium]